MAAKGCFWYQNKDQLIRQILFVGTDDLVRDRRAAKKGNWE